MSTSTSAPSASHPTPASSSSPPAFFSVSGFSGPDWASWTGLTFALSRGDVLLLRGESGSGKSTLLKALADLLPPSPSSSSSAKPFSIHLKGCSHTDIPSNIYRSRVLYIPQRPSLLAGTPRDFWDTVCSFSANRSTERLNDIVQRCSKDANARSDTNGRRISSGVEDVEQGAVNGNIVAAWVQSKGWTLEEVPPEDPMEASASGQNLSARPPSPSPSASPHARTASPTPSTSSTSISSKTRPLRTSTSKTLPRLPPAIPYDPMFLGSSEWSLPTSVWDRDWASLSGGEAQRVALAVGLCLLGGSRNNSERNEGASSAAGGGGGKRAEGVLLLDEPTSALDTRTTQLIERILLLSREKMTIIWVTHDDAQARRVARLVQEDNVRRRSAPPTKLDEEEMEGDGVGKERKVWLLKLDGDQQQHHS